MKCIQCGTEMAETRGDHKYRELPGLLLRGVRFRHCPNCGEEEVSIPRIERLHRAVALALAAKPERLTNNEIRFLRKHLGWSRDDCAGIMDVVPETVSRWENGRIPMSRMAERFLRLAVIRLEPVSDYPSERLRDVATRKARPLKAVMEPTGDGWQAVA
ncbi:MAG: type II TA system antitoxin MqsA family protein [Myxococcota bacterium]